MPTLSTESFYRWDLNLSGRAAELMRLFGIRLLRLRDQRLAHNCKIDLDPGHIAIITGPSGCGKTTLLRGLYADAPEDDRIALNDIDCPRTDRVIDCISGSVWQASGLLCNVGLSNTFTMLGRVCDLSDGQQWRYQLAKALDSGKQWIFADDYAAKVSRIMAMTISINLRKIAEETGRIFVLASCHEDMLCELQPDVVVIKSLNGTGHIVYKKSDRRESIIPYAQDTEGLIDPGK